LQAYEKNGFMPNIVFSPTEPTAYLKLACQGVGIALHPEHWRNFIEINDSLVEIPIIAPELYWEICLTYNNTRIRTPNEKLFIQHILAYYRNRTAVSSLQSPEPLG